MINFSIERAKNKQFYATFKGNNGEMVWRTSEEYTRKADAIKSITVIAKKFFSCMEFRIMDNTTPGLPNKKHISTIKILQK